MQKKHWIGMAAILALSGAVHGYWMHRWDAFAAGTFDHSILAATTADLGEWEGAEVQPQEENHYRPFSVSRRYVNRLRDRTAIVSLISGIPRKVATHTPEVCYPGSGYQQKTEKVREIVKLPSGGEAAFWVAEFEKTTVTGKERLRVRWAWTLDGTWEAPDWARLHYSTSPVLHKLYVVHPVSEGEPIDDPVYHQLIGLLVEQLNQQIRQ